MKKIILTLGFLSLGLLAIAQETPKLAFKEYENYKPCNSCVDADQWNKGNPKVNSNATGNNSVNKTVNGLETQVKNKGKFIIGIVSVALLGTITAVILSKSNSITNVLTQ